MITKSTIISWLGTDKNDLAQRMLKLIRSGHNITEYLIDNNDIFVYEKECINEQIIKKTPNKPQIGSIVQLEHNPKVKVYKHIEDNGYNYWYCKYLPNNGQDYKPTY